MSARLLVVAVSLLAASGTVRGQCEITEIQKITAFDGAADDWFGGNVDVDGWLAVIGASRDDLAVSNTGSAYVYAYDGVTWQLDQKLLPSRGDAAVRFGASVAIAGDLIAVGAPEEGNGFVDVFRHEAGTWVLEATLTASDGGWDDRFGQCVSTTGERVLVGAQHDDDLGWDSGSAYVYRDAHGGWVQEQKLHGSDTDASDQFGFSVSLDGDLALVGAAGWDDRGTESAGAAYVFRFDGRTWAEETVLLATDGISDRAFGNSLTVRHATPVGDVALVGAFRDDEQGANAGAVYYFHSDGVKWKKVQKLIPVDADDGDLFGRSVDSDEDLAVIGAYNKEGGGAAYTYRHDGTSWAELLKLVASDREGGDLFGNSVAIDDDFVFIGAIDEDSAATNAGAAYFFPARRHLQLLVYPGAVDPGDPVCFLTYFGKPGDPVLLALVDVEGTPLFKMLALGSFQIPSFQWLWCATVPDSLADLDLTVQSIGINMCGDVSLSNRAALTIR